MFNITQSKGFQLTLENGWTVSVQWGPGNYCENYNVLDYKAPKTCDSWKSQTAEIAAWDKNNMWYQFKSGNTVSEHCSVADVVDFINLINSK